MRIFSILILLLCAPSLGFAASQAPLIGAWLENDNIIVKCELPAGQPLANAEVSIFETPSNAPVAQGRSDHAGFFAFAIPNGVREGRGLLIIVNAGQGNVGEWTMTAAELYAASSLTAGFDEARETAQTPPIPAPVINNANARPAMMGELPQESKPAISADEIKTIVNDILEEKLEPILKELNNREKTGVNWWELLGAAGWLAGLFGIFLYFVGRRKS